MRRSRIGRLTVGLLGAVFVVPLVGCVADAAPVIESVVAGDTQVTVSWQPPPGSVPGSVVAYDVQAYSGSVALPVVRFNSTATTQTISGLVNGTTYTFHVRAIHPTRGKTAWSEPSNAVTYNRPPAIAVAGGYAHTCAVLSDGAGRCWGWNDRGRLGNGVLVLGDAANSSIPVTVSGLTDATAIAVGYGHACARTSGGAVLCWGDGSNGKLGHGGGTSSVSIPVSAVGITDATAVAAGWAHSCAVLEDGAARCWGYNIAGQLGNGLSGTAAESQTPVPVVGITDATGIATGWTQSCAVLAGGTVKCWGDNFYGELGNGTTVDSPNPVTVTGLTDATDVTTGHRHGCARLADGTVQCWGDNEWGQLGDGTTVDSPSPVPVTGLNDAVAVSANGFHTCALHTTGSISCWGNNGAGKLGDGTTASSSSPVSVIGITDAIAVTPGFNHTCAVLSQGTVNCWGWSLHGQIGNGTTQDSPTPVPVAGW